jgi:DNA-directed RNA polymerase
MRALVKTFQRPACSLRRSLSLQYAVAPRAQEAARHGDRHGPGGSSGGGKRQRQLEIETATLDEACAKYDELLKNLIKLGKTSHLKAAQRQIVEWYGPLVERIVAEQSLVAEGVASADRKLYGPMLLMLPADKLAVIAMHSVINVTVNAGDRGAPFTKVCNTIAEAVQAEVNLTNLKTKFGKVDLKNVTARKINLRARLSLEDGDWSNDLKVKLGAALVNILIDSAKDEDGSPAFYHRTVRLSYNHRVGNICASSKVYAKLLESDAREYNPRNLPMLVEPKLWTRWDRGGFLKLRTTIMRTKGSRAQVDALRNAPLERVFEGLNALGRLRWAVNRDVLNVVQDAWDAKLAIAELPSQFDIPLPQPPTLEEIERDPGLAREHAFKTKRDQMKNHDLHSLRCDAKNKLSIAHKFAEDEIYFPYNMDFRGRAYPIPPNLNHLGSDMCRGMLTVRRITPFTPLPSSAPPPSDLLVRPPARLFLTAEFSLSYTTTTTTTAATTLSETFTLSSPKRKRWVRRASSG